ncbi:hypothetical protein ACWEVD_05570 [Nocardia thailandica]
MDRSDAHRPAGAWRTDSGPARDPLAPEEDLSTPAGIPVVSLTTAGSGRPAPSLSRFFNADAYDTDKLPVVGGPFDPAAGQQVYVPAEPDNGPDTDRLPIVRLLPATGFADTWTAGAPAARGEPATAPAAVSAPAAPDDPTALDEVHEAAEADGADRPAPDYFGDDEVFARMIDRSRRRAIPRWAGPLAASVAAAVLAGGAYLQFSGPAPRTTSASAPLAEVSAPGAVIPVAGQCPDQQIGDRIQGSGPGGTDSGVAAILAFQYAYYVARSGDQAHTLAAPDATIPAGAEIQRGIDTIPIGTSHCLSITPTATAGQYRVVITEFRPDSAPRIYNAQLVGTAKVNGKTLITSIGPA